MGKVGQDEMPQLMIIASPEPRQSPCEGIDYNEVEAANQSDRCLACGCLSHGSCKLETYAIAYGADPTRFAGQRRPYEVLGRPGSVLFEPGKCIKCELCVKIATAAGEPLGLTFVGRGFDVQLSVPFDHDLDEGLSRVAAECVAACPTAALSFGRPIAQSTAHSPVHAAEDTTATPNPE
jgi:predicted molibdopterin-dependent oxidoreductase YjgC